MKKMLIMLIVALISMTTVVLAYGHGRISHGASNYSFCDVEDCYTDVMHRHHGKMYYGHTVDDGHEHRLCWVEDCWDTQNHWHDGEVCFPKDFDTIDHYSYNMKNKGCCR